MARFKEGLQDVVAATSSICYIDGQKGILSYRGIDIHDLAEHSTFEEVCYLLWFGHLPKQTELDEMKAVMGRSRDLPEPVVQLLNSLPADAPPMDVLRTAVSALSHFDPDVEANDKPANLRKTYRLTGQIASIVATADRLRNGLEPVIPDPGLSHAANFVYMLTGKKPDATAERALDVALILHADHEFKA